MPSLRLIAVALLAASAAALVSLGARAEPLDPDLCKSLEAEKKTLLTNELKAALERGPDWVKDHLHSAEDIEKVRQYLLIEEKVAFRCRTDGVVIPKPMPPPLPDPKPPVPIIAVEGQKVLAGAAATSLLPLRKPSSTEPEALQAAAVQEPPEPSGDADEIATSGDTDDPDPGPSQP